MTILQIWVLRIALSSAKLESSRNRYRESGSLFVGHVVPEHDMVKPGLLSVGIGIGLISLGGSGIAIPVLWSQANHVKIDRDELQDSLREARLARVVAEDAQTAAELERDEMEKQLATGVENLTTAEETKRELTAQLAKLQDRDLDLNAVSGTLQLRNKETVALRQQLEQSRSDYADLLARRDVVEATGNASSDLVPLPPRAEVSGTSQTTAKPAANEPIRFDDRGWRPAAPSIR
jgi:hypothetical protein